ncbi:MAG: hypothetical protein WC477_02105 [Patescibacteria group bacterium]
MHAHPKLLSNCPLCQAQYEDQSIRLIAENGATRMFHLTCASCAHSVIAMITEYSHGTSSLGMVTDLEAQDALRFQDAEPISADDCLQFHDMIGKESLEFCGKINQD